MIYSLQPTLAWNTAMYIYLNRLSKEQIASFGTLEWQQKVYSDMIGSSTRELFKKYAVPPIIKVFFCAGNIFPRIYFSSSIEWYYR